ncbi:hypothetical protein [Myxosarcina sp. GI1]|uniref:hypothetical protein n=1 Tax=Myxosarcina sp. GI1 TaxID=1541065 RepID=UPI00055B5492|nr:hypothetical protein [Myxosarcina sp. GI1]
MRLIATDWMNKTFLRSKTKVSEESQKTVEFQTDLAPRGIFGNDQQEYVSSYYRIKDSVRF